jgi:hypothetical protein
VIRLSLRNEDRTLAIEQLGGRIETTVSVPFPDRECGYAVCVAGSAAWLGREVPWTPAGADGAMGIPVLGRMAYFYRGVGEAMTVFNARHVRAVEFAQLRAGWELPAELEACE